MKNESADYQRGYDEAIAVHGVAHQPGFFKSREEADLVTQVMWQAGLNETEATAQRSDFLTAHRQRDQKINKTLQAASAGGNGRIVRPSVDGDGFEGIAEVYERRRRELAKSSTNDGQDKSKDKAVEWAMVSPQN